MTHTQNTPAMTAEELKSCPFCGSKPRSHHCDMGRGMQSSSVSCRCGASVGKCDLTAEAVWNTRPEPAPGNVRMLRDAVSRYFERYMLDEAESPENCVCGEQQYRDALAVKHALAATETATEEAGKVNEPLVNMQWVSHYLELNFPQISLGALSDIIEFFRPYLRQPLTPEAREKLVEDMVDAIRGLKLYSVYGEQPHETLSGAIAIAQAALTIAEKALLGKGGQV